ncbi:MAG: tetratricopeptide repeat protein [Spongiibacteraceae bacterium]
MRSAFAIVLTGSLLLTACHSTAPISDGEAAAAVPATDEHDHAEEGVSEATEPVPPVHLRPFPAATFYDLLVAEFALHRGEYELALGNYLEQAQATHDVAVTERATRIAQFVKSDRAALEAAKLWVEVEPDDPEAQFTLGSQLAKAQQPLAALPHMAKVLESGARANFAVIAASAAALPIEDRQQLLTEFDKLLVEYPGTTELMTGKALLLQELDRKDEALQLVRKVLDTSPDETHAILIESKLLQELGRDGEANNRLENMVNQYPFNRRLRLQYARQLTQTDMSEAREQFAILVQQSPNDADLLLSLALVSREVNALADAERYFQQLLTLNQHVAEAHFYLGALSEQRGDAAKAIFHYEQVPPGDEFFPALARVVELRLAEKNVDGARKFLADTRSRFPQHALRLYLFEAEVLMQVRRYDDGNKLLTAALKQFPAQPNLLYSRSTFSEKRRDLPLLEKDLRAILKIDPDNAVALNALGYTLANQTKRYDEAYTLISRALALKPDDPAVLDSMGWVEFRRGNLKVARDLLEKAYAKFPDPEVAAHYGEALWSLGEREQARAVWGKALEGEAEAEQVRETMKRLGVR